jgi:hypothetical protein
MEALLEDGWKVRKGKWRMDEGDDKTEGIGFSCAMIQCR